MGRWHYGKIGMLGVHIDPVCCMNEYFDGIHPRYFSPMMRRRILENSIVGNSRFGRGLFATRDLDCNTMMGYYSGPVLTWNNWEKYRSEDHYIAIGKFTHPGSGKKMTYQIMVVGPTRYMNHGHRREDFRSRTPRHGMVANVVMMPEQMLKIENRYRPVYGFRTIQPVKQGEELLYDYGVHREELYYEVLRRHKSADSASRRRAFHRVVRGIERSSYRRWLNAREWDFEDDWDALNAFHHDLLVGFLNSPDAIRYPNRDMVFL